MFHIHPQPPVGTIPERNSFRPALCQPTLHNSVWSETGLDDDPLLVTLL